jgi:hypothetical protein
MTDFENAAFAIFIVLLTRVILSYELNLYIPISKVWLTAPPAKLNLLTDGRWTKTWPQHTAVILSSPTNSGSVKTSFLRGPYPIRAPPRPRVPDRRYQSRRSML